MTSSDNSFEAALLRYREDVFTDADVARCTGLSPRSVRELIKIGAVRTRSDDRGAGRVRTFDAVTFKRLAILAAVNDAGFSLRLAGSMTYLLPSDDLLYRTYDPINVLCDTAASGDAVCGLPPRLLAPKFDWFDPAKPATSDPKNDWLLEIFDGRFVALVVQKWSFRLIYGDLRKDGTKFVNWLASHAQLPAAFSTETRLRPKWAGGRKWADRIDPESLDYRYECHESDDDPLRLTGYAAAQRPIFKTTINIALAIRLALRRYLDLEPLLLDVSDE